MVRLGLSARWRSAGDCPCEHSRDQRHDSEHFRFLQRMQFSYWHHDEVAKPPSGWNFTLHRDPIEYAIRLAVVVDRVMHRAAIVPHHDIACAPHMAIEVVGLRGVRVEEIK